MYTHERQNVLLHLLFQNFLKYYKGTLKKHVVCRSTLKFYGSSKKFPNNKLTSRTTITRNTFSQSNLKNWIKMWSRELLLFCSESLTVPFSRSIVHRTGRSMRQVYAIRLWSFLQGFRKDKDQKKCLSLVLWRFTSVHLPIFLNSQWSCAGHHS